MKPLMAMTNIVCILPPPLNLENLLPCQTAIYITLQYYREASDDILSQKPTGNPFLQIIILRCAEMNHNSIEK